MLQFFPDNAAKRGLQWLVGATDVLPESIIDQALVVAASGPLNLTAKPLERIVVKADGDSCLTRWHRNHRSPFCFC
jgi:hypothetical protein